VDTVHAPDVDTDDDDHDSSSDDQEHLQVQPATFKLIMPPASSRSPSDFRRRVIVQPVHRHETDASLMVPPGMQDRLKDEHEEDGPADRRTGRKAQ